jgi:hypothetical protein
MTVAGIVPEITITFATPTPPMANATLPSLRNKLWNADEPTARRIDSVELRQLSYLAAVADETSFRPDRRAPLPCRTFALAADPQSELGTQLLVRDRRHVELTPAGSRFPTDAREVSCPMTAVPEG